MKVLAPLVVFAFNRPENLEKLLSSLSVSRLAKESDVFFFVDGPRNNIDFDKIRQCIEVISKYECFFHSIEINRSTINKGLAESLIGGVSEVIRKYNKVIVLEDDLIVSKDFIEYMNHSLDLYENIERINSVSGFSTLINCDESNKVNYFHPRPCSWGWGTWKSKWEKCDWNYRPRGFMEKLWLWNKCRKAGQDVFRMYRNQNNGTINSWAIRWTIHAIRGDQLVSYPFISRVSNSGFGESATHCKGRNPFLSIFGENDFIEKPFETSLELNSRIVSQVNHYHSNMYKIIFRLKGYL